MPAMLDRRLRTTQRSAAPLLRLRQGVAPVKIELGVARAAEVPGGYVVVAHGYGHLGSPGFFPEQPVSIKVIFEWEAPPGTSPPGLIQREDGWITQGGYFDIEFFAGRSPAVPEPEPANTSSSKKRWEK